MVPMHGAPLCSHPIKRGDADFRLSPECAQEMKDLLFSSCSYPGSKCLQCTSVGSLREAKPRQREKQGLWGRADSA